MGISLAKAITSVKEDDNYILKITIGGMLTVLPFILFVLAFVQDKLISLIILSFAALILSGLYITGFVFETGNKQLNTDSPDMAEWKNPGLFKTGLKTAAVYFVYSIIIVIFSFITGFIVGILAVISALLLKSISFIPTDIIFTVLSNLVGIFVGLVVALFVNTAFTSFMVNLKMGDMLALKKHYKIIVENSHASWTLIGKMILYGILFCLISLVFAAFVVTSALLPFLYFAACIVYVNLLVQYGKEINIQKYFA